MRRLFEVAPLTRCDQPLSLGVKERVPGEVKRRGGHDQWRLVCQQLVVLVSYFKQEHGVVLFYRGRFSQLQ